MRYSIVVPVYRNEASIYRLLDVLSSINQEVGGELEVVFVVDGSPDRSFELLQNGIEQLSFPAQLLALSRNFGSFAAIRAGLTAARGEFFGVMAADLQEPPELLISFFRHLNADECDVAIGTRYGRSDPLVSRIASQVFWGLYRRIIVPEMPDGGVDIFGCNRAFRDELLKLEESRSSLIALIFWLGFRRKFVGYTRLVRTEGKSAWTFRKKIDYMLDSVFAFTDYPIKMLFRFGLIGSALSAVLGSLVLIGHVAGKIVVPGYAATMMVSLFFGALNLLGLGLVGTYAWRGYENSKARPSSVVAIRKSNCKGGV
ncbi:Glycosyltransferase involved in cell wall bisynthesis [Aromatoleum tolulyticum]|uniref:Glycosyltransferase involved in cell wall bisynthesis n=1 Tax=Aromatoleum tolulyticum TaxID=34027 RepID=A0A1N6UUM2_9RHOO|nr:glycosyltransferase family 2 protein [Aromatoleum tolulyticum]SIQ69172.1 Glycosyltransferase involved in cell wall bisynthesis [Aromatoleum tolulyticum]